METLTKDKMLDFFNLLVRVVGHVSPSIDNQVLKSYICAIDALPLHLRHNRIIVVI
jgi:hypothetical protein